MRIECFLDRRVVPIGRIPFKDAVIAERGVEPCLRCGQSVGESIDPAGTDEVEQGRRRDELGVPKRNVRGARQVELDGLDRRA